ncbi:hypothetical protein B566_EDAN013002 [Ephemera danica]|nr:hypothetical protein B566_EDAN013002 [Ephemera danica]
MLRLYSKGIVVGMVHNNIGNIDVPAISIKASMKKDKYVVHNLQNLDGQVITNSKDVVGKEGPDNAGDDGPERQQWTSPVEFLMSCIAMSVGLGNVWRFPFTAYKNGGGAFLIPYIIVLVIVGKPFYYMELSLGQFSSVGPVKVWEVVPALRGVGLGQMLSASALVTYYCSIMAISMYYFFASFSAELPWSTCHHSWDDCFDSSRNYSGTGINTTVLRSPTQIYFKDVVLHEIPNIDDGIGSPSWQLSLCLLFSWITICLVLIKGVQSSGKAAYFLALFPYVVLIILLIRGCLLPGSAEGIMYFINPQWEKLLEAEVWYAAVTQCFFSLSVGFGPLIMYSSYNGFRHNVHRDALIVTTMDTFTSLLAGFTVFAILGNLAYERGVDISNVVQGGPGLAFVSYPETIAKFDAVPQLFSVLFFLMLYTLGIGSAISLVGAVITVYCDQFPTHRRWIVTLVICISGFLIGLVYVTPGGQYILVLVDYFSGNFIIYILAIIEIVGISWIYGLDNFCRDIEFMLGHKVGPYWKLCWFVVTPIFLMCVLVYRFVNLKLITYNDNQAYPEICYGTYYS